MNHDLYDIIIIGAGLSGIAAARFYLATHPTSRIILLEKDGSIGGAWSKDRLYPNFMAQTGLRISGFSDVPLTVPEPEKLFHDLFDASVFTDYLENYLDSHVYAGTSLRERIVTQFEVTRVDKREDIWHVTGTHLDSQQSLKSTRLIVASGMTSSPKMPILIGQELFGGPVVHQKTFGAFCSTWPSNHDRVAVLGGAKSAADAVYSLAKAGKTVHWIIRASGRGPGIFLNPGSTARKPLLSDPELGCSRMFATMSPGCFVRPSLLEAFLHRTRLGGMIVRRFWEGMKNIQKRFGDFHARKGALGGFEKMESNVDPFYLTGPIGLVQKPDFWDTIAKNVHIHRNDISHLADHSLVLENGPTLPIDVLICATGWNFEYSFLTPAQQHALNLSGPKIGDAHEAAWEALEAAADIEVLRRFPHLANPSKVTKPASDPWKGRNPARLYNCMTPLSDPSIAFLGNTTAFNTFRLAEVQAVWLTALFDGVLSLPSPDEMRKDVAWVNAFMKRRFPTLAPKGYVIQHDFTGYVDRSLGQVGVSSHRKGRGWWRGWWSGWVMPLLAADMKGTAEEYVEKFGGRGGEEEGTRAEVVEGHGRRESEGARPESIASK